MCDCVLLACCGACALALFLAGLYLTFGVIFIVLAARAKSAVSSHQVLITDDLSLYPNLCIAIGVFFTLLTVIAVVGEKNGKKTRIAYAVAQVLVLGLTVYIFAATNPGASGVGGHIFKGLNDTIQDYGINMTGRANVTFEWDKLQEELTCCGVNNYLDWEAVTKEAKLEFPTPTSCCRSEHRMRGCSAHVRFDHPAESNKLINVQGCLEPVRAEILGRIGILGYFLIPILIITSFGFVTTCCSSGVKKGDEEFKEKKMGPIVVRTNTKKKKGVTDIENPAESTTPAIKGNEVEDGPEELPATEAKNATNQTETNKTVV